MNKLYVSILYYILYIYYIILYILYHIIYIYTHEQIHIYIHMYTYIRNYIYTYTLVIFSAEIVIFSIENSQWKFHTVLLFTAVSHLQYIKRAKTLGVLSAANNRSPHHPTAIHRHINC